MASVVPVVTSDRVSRFITYGSHIQKWCCDTCVTNKLNSISMAEKNQSGSDKSKFEFVKKDTNAMKIHACRGFYISSSITDEDEDEYRDPEYLCTKDMKTQCQTVSRLYQSGWYYENLSSPEAKKLLSKLSLGTFIIRDSSDPKYLYSVSVKTARGTTSVRILYHRGYFQLDCEERIRSKMPRFDCVVRLVDFYVRLSISDKNHICRWLESNGRKDLPILLKKPKLNNVLDLKHISRLTINRSLPSTTSITTVHRHIDTLLVPPSVKRYLKDYPFLN